MKLEDYTIEQLRAIRPEVGQRMRQTIDRVIRRKKNAQGMAAGVAAVWFSSQSNVELVRNGSLPGGGFALGVGIRELR